MVVSWGCETSVYSFSVVVIDSITPLEIFTVWLGIVVPETGLIMLALRKIYVR